GVAGTATAFFTPGETTGGWLAGEPSNASAGVASNAAPNANATMVRSDVRIALFLVRATGVGYGPSHCRPNLLGIFPERARRMVSLARAPFGFAFREFCVAQFYVKGSDDRIDLDDVAIFQQADRSANGGFRPDMADAEAARGAGEPAVSDECDLTAGALPGQRSRGREHFPHAGTAARALVADDDDLAFPVGALLDGLEGVLLAVEAAGRPGKLQVRHARDFHDRSFWREVALQADHTAGDGDRLVGRPHHILVRVPFHAFEVFCDRSAGDCQTIPMQMTVIEQGLHQK